MPLTRTRPAATRASACRRECVARRALLTRTGASATASAARRGSTRLAADSVPLSLCTARCDAFCSSSRLSHAACGDSATRSDRGVYPSPWRNSSSVARRQLPRGIWPRQMEPTAIRSSSSTPEPTA
eukprot:scaffold31815_cov118-Isochrysis_galbana.AAC.19